MKLPKLLLMLVVVLAAAGTAGCLFRKKAGVPAGRKTTVSIVLDEFHINGRATYAGRMWNGKKIQGLLMNSRMVQGIFDDRNPATVSKWAYPDTGKWDPARNTSEFIAAMPEWRRHGLLAFTINLQGGSPQGYSREQPWHNSGIEPDGSLNPEYLARLERILDTADELGMVAILGYFYFGQDQRLKDEGAVIKAVDNITHWLFTKGYRNVLIEINNEANVRYDHAILQPARVHELIERVKQTSRNGRRLLVGTSYGGGTIPLPNVVGVSDFILIHGNGIAQPDRIADMARKTRQVAGYKPMPVLFNEDDHFEFDKPANNFTAATGEYASWGYFDPGASDYRDGYQCPPVNWGINTERKRQFFNLVAEMTGAKDSGGTATPSYRTMSIRRTSYHGWTNSILLNNGTAEVTIVPAIGRVMQFKFNDQASGPFWEHRDLDGKPVDPQSKDWVNFGGDKTWPAPQADWPRITPRGWPPPVAFDSMPVEAHVEGEMVRLVSPVDPHFGIRTERRVWLDPDRPEMTITTTFEKVQGAPSRVAVWTITQLNDPVLAVAPIPRNSIFPQGYNKQSDALPLALRLENGLLSMIRNPKASHKVGMDSDALVWIGKDTMLRIDSPRLAGREYPDQGSSAEVYTNPDPAQYVELEMLGPLEAMNVGSRISRTNVYSLFKRTSTDALIDAKKVLGK